MCLHECPRNPITEQNDPKLVEYKWINGDEPSELSQPFIMKSPTTDGVFTVVILNLNHLLLFLRAQTKRQTKQRNLWNLWTWCSVGDDKSFAHQVPWTLKKYSCSFSRSGSAGLIVDPGCTRLPANAQGLIDAFSHGNVSSAVRQRPWQHRVPSKAHNRAYFWAPLRSRSSPHPQDSRAGRNPSRLLGC